ncbi:MAG: hypothetical protein RLZZ440_824 [Planctomycetota bacterium]|jgi:hypothetical protein
MKEDPHADATADRRPTVEAVFDERLHRLPREVGAMLVTIGVLGLALPGLVGTPALLAGGLVLWPRGFHKVNRWIGARWPKVHRKSLEQVLRFLDDLERRYPTTDPVECGRPPKENHHELT